MATVFTDFFLHKLQNDVRLWYDENFYPIGYNGLKGEVEYHLDVMRRFCNWDKIKGDNIAEKRINLLTSVQEVINKLYMGENV